jgi:hypothetical protein
MVLSFQIRKPFIEESSSSPTPVVMIDTEDGSPSIFTDQIQDEDPRVHLLQEVHFTSTQPHELLIPPLEGEDLLLKESTVPPLSFSSVPWDMTDELSPAHHVSCIYPMRIILHQNLRQLIVIEDGSTVFQKTSPDTFFVTPSFAEVQPKVEFNVEIDVESGKIIHSTCVKELVDKRLQWLAELILSKFRCIHPEKKGHGCTIVGKMTLQFAGTFDTLCRVVAWEHIDD